MATSSIKQAAYINAAARYSTLLLGMLFNAILARILSPEDFGIVAITFVFTTLFTLLADMGLGAGIIQNKDLTREDIGSLFAFSLRLGLILTAAFALFAYPMSLFYGLPTNGLVQEGEQGCPYSASDASYHGPGSINYIDVDGDGYITDMDRTIIGDPNPKFTYGFNTSLRWKSLTLTANFVGCYGNDLYNVNKMMDSNTSYVMTNITKDTFYQQWTPETPGNWYPTIGALNADDVKWAVDRYVEDGSYLRLSNLSLSWDVPIKKKDFFIRGVNITASGGNLWVWTKYSSWDPDVNSYGSVWRKGADMGSYPSARSVSFNVRFTF